MGLVIRGSSDSTVRTLSVLCPLHSDSGYGGFCTGIYRRYMVLYT
jgi:hypothetical protein